VTGKMEAQDYFSMNATAFNDSTMFTDFDSYVYDTNLPENAKEVWDWNRLSGALNTTIMDSDAIDKSILDDITLGNTGMMPMQNMSIQDPNTLSFSQDSIFNSSSKFLHFACIASPSDMGGLRLLSSCSGEWADWN
jgi:hypothetical protein